MEFLSLRMRRVGSPTHQKGTDAMRSMMRRIALSSRYSRALFIAYFAAIEGHKSLGPPATVAVEL